MNDRQEKLLNNIIEEFYSSAQPVGSSLLVQKYCSNLSSATIRNEMAILEKDGYIIQPHTSAGRIPTEKGYNYYLDNMLQDVDLSKDKQNILSCSFKKSNDFRINIKNLSKDIAEISGDAVFIAFNKNDFYYTGISNILAKPEFYSHELILNISQVIDHFDEVLSNIFNTINNNISIMIGSKNPFNINCATIVTKYNIEGVDHLIGILGAKRMNYKENKSILKYFKNNII